VVIVEAVAVTAVVVMDSGARTISVDALPGLEVLFCSSRQDGADTSDCGLTC
jgi:hypothetical protein